LALSAAVFEIKAAFENKTAWRVAKLHEEKNDNRQVIDQRKQIAGKEEIEFYIIKSQTKIWPLSHIPLDITFSNSKHKTHPINPEKCNSIEFIAGYTAGVIDSV